MKEKRQPKYPEALSRDFMEGGYTFLHRVFRTNIDSGNPVIINSGNLYFKYDYSSDHTSFRQGITLIDGSDAETEKIFYKVVDNFDLNQAIQEGGYKTDRKGNLTKKRFLSGVRGFFSRGEKPLVQIEKIPKNK